MRDLTFTRRNILAAAAAGGLISVTGLRFAAAQGNDRRTLKVGMSRFPAALDPALDNSTATRRVVPQMFDTLIGFDQTEKMALRPALAERWERVDATALRLFLRKGVTFHDGSPFTSRDVAFSLSPDHLLGPGKAGKTVAMQTLDTVDRVEIVDDHTVIVRAKGDDSLLEKRLASWASEIVSSHAFDAAGSWDKWIQAPVGTGPYRIVSQTLDVNVVLAAFDAYWGGEPPYAGIEYRIIPELASRMNALAAGEVDFITDLSPDLFAEIERQSGLEVAGGAVQNIRCLAIDTTGPVLSQVGVRRALSLALDRKALVEALWQSRVPIPNGFQFPSFGEGYIEDFPALAYDPDLASKLLTESGYKGETIAYKLLNNYYPNQVASAQIMVEMWRAVGLNVEIQMMENFAQIEKKPINAIYDNSTTAIFPDLLAHAWRLLGPNGELPKLGIWQDKEFFALGEKLKSTVEPADRRAIIRRMLETIDHGNPPCVILHGSGQFYGKRKDIAWGPGQTLDLNFGPFNAAYTQN
ncbi:ABC transporter substrate-binding protein [Phyllobacterium zundukense]|uniref:Oligopeptide ABC transporter substrate-binding protein n=1 Tax=Phyllobacterium zundukense TaxID=1867719 RepID=A0A2N9VZ12_9HYPH|nr:ABC transporter substrate-binding protein [Phyllobacterium zundukense]ATU95525.1 oligopeptide ABC transpoter oligopeptide-binding protein [Phyllobacterium zundukense]PIO44730.1 oligopeptide ABC transporter substrate-binding protein [Phyllobacterium zundukense]